MAREANKAQLSVVEGTEVITDLILGYLRQHGIKDVGPKQLASEAAGVLDEVGTAFGRVFDTAWGRGYKDGIEGSATALTKLKAIYTAINKFIDHPHHEADPYWANAVAAVRRIRALRIMNHIEEQKP